jgi:molybdopterin molybdotransferase
VAGATDATSVPVKVVGAVVMGEVPSQAVAAGEAMEIPTGGVMPAGADAVVMIERVAVGAGGSIRVKQAVEPGRNVVGKGGDIARGDQVLAVGRRLGAREIAVLAAMGVDKLAVYARPRVAVVSSWGELCAPGGRPGPAEVRDANQAALAAAVVAAGGVATCAGILPDDPDALAAGLRALAGKHDVVLLTGGSSVGGKDFTGEVFKRMGRLLFHGIHVRPGKPTLAAKAGRTLLVGLPGVPAAALIIFQVFVRPLLRQLAGETTPALLVARARLAATLPPALGREDYVRVRLVDREGVIWAEPVTGGTASLAALLAADGFVIVASASARLTAGAEVAVHPLG